MIFLVCNLEPCRLLVFYVLDEQVLDVSHPVLFAATHQFKSVSVTLDQANLHLILVSTLKKSSDATSFRTHPFSLFLSDDLNV